MILFQGSSFANTSVSVKNNSDNGTPIAIDDVFILSQGCDDANLLIGNVFDNDDYNGADSVKIAYAFNPTIGMFSIGPNGNFIFKCDSIRKGETQFIYRICNVEKPELYSEATVTILIEPDNDCDGVADIVDLDDDNDGILDIHEGEEDDDFDEDGIPNRLDIDSDNDCITDFIEWQNDSSTIHLLLSDMNRDGWDDAFDGSTGGEYYEQVDTDSDGSPDFLDTDSDNDDVEDFIESCDADNDGVPDYLCIYSDRDLDGLDDIFDNVEGWKTGLNSVGSCAPLPDTNNNSLRDWRDQSNHPLKEGEENMARTKNQLIIFPNPVQQSCSVKIPVENEESTEYQVYLHDLKGKLLIHETVNKTLFELNLQGLNAETFLLHVESANDHFFGKIAKQN